MSKMSGEGEKASRARDDTGREDLDHRTDSSDLWAWDDLEKDMKDQASGVDNQDCGENRATDNATKNIVKSAACGQKPVSSALVGLAAYGQDSTSESNNSEEESCMPVEEKGIHDAESDVEKNIAERKGRNLKLVIEKDTSVEAEKQVGTGESPDSKTKSPRSLVFQNLEILQKMAENIEVDKEKDIEKVVETDNAEKSEELVKSADREELEALDVLPEKVCSVDGDNAERSEELVKSADKEEIEALDVLSEKVCSVDGDNAERSEDKKKLETLDELPKKVCSIDEDNVEKSEESLKSADKEVLEALDVLPGEVCSVDGDNQEKTVTSLQTNVDNEDVTEESPKEAEGQIEQTNGESLDAVEEISKEVEAVNDVNNVDVTEECSKEIEGQIDQTNEKDVDAAHEKSEEVEAVNQVEEKMEVSESVGHELQETNETDFRKDTFEEKDGGEASSEIVDNAGNKLLCDPHNDVLENIGENILLNVSTEGQRKTDEVTSDVEQPTLNLERDRKIDSNESSDGPELASPDTTQKVWGALRSEVTNVAGDMDTEMSSFVEDLKQVDNASVKDEKLIDDDSISTAQQIDDNSYSSLPKTFHGFKPKKRTFNVNFPVPESYRAVLRLPDVLASMTHITGSIYSTPDIVRIDQAVLRDHFGEEFVTGFFDSATSEEDNFFSSLRETKASGGDRFEKVRKRQDCSIDRFTGSGSAVKEKKGRGRPRKSENAEISNAGKKMESEVKERVSPSPSLTPNVKQNTSVSNEKEPGTPTSLSEVSWFNEPTAIGRSVGIFDSQCARNIPPTENETKPRSQKYCHGGGRGTGNMGGGNFMLNQKQWWETVPKKRGYRKGPKPSIGEGSEVESVVSFESRERSSAENDLSAEDVEIKPKVALVKKTPTAKKSTGGHQTQKVTGAIKSEKVVSVSRKIKQEKPPKKKMDNDHNNIKNLFNLMSLGRLEIIVERCDAMVDSSVVIVKKERGDSSFVDVEGVDESFEPLNKRSVGRKKSKSPSHHRGSGSESVGDSFCSGDEAVEVSYEKFIEDECESPASDEDNIGHSDSDGLDSRLRKRTRLNKSSESEDETLEKNYFEKRGRGRPKSKKEHEKKDRSKKKVVLDSDSDTSDDFETVVKKPTNRDNKINKRGRGRPKKEVIKDKLKKNKRSVHQYVEEDLPDFSSTDDEVEVKKEKSPRVTKEKISKKGLADESMKSHVSGVAEFSSDEEKVKTGPTLAWTSAAGSEKMGNSSWAPFKESLKKQINSLVDSPRLWDDDKEPPRQGQGMTRHDSAPIFIKCSKSKSSSLSSASDSDDSMFRTKEEVLKKVEDHKGKQSKEARSKAFDTVRKLGPKSKQRKENKSDPFDDMKKLGPKRGERDEDKAKSSHSKMKNLGPKSKKKTISATKLGEGEVKDVDIHTEQTGKKEKVTTDKTVLSGSESDVQVLPNPPKPVLEMVKISSDSQDSEVEVHSIPTTEGSAAFVDVEMGFSSDDVDVASVDVPEQSDKETTVPKKVVDIKVQKRMEADMLKEFKVKPANVKLTKLNYEVRRFLRKRKRISMKKIEQLTGFVIQKKPRLEKQESCVADKKLNIETEKPSEKHSSSDTERKGFFESLQDDNESSPERPMKEKSSENDCSKKISEEFKGRSSAESGTGSLGSDVELTVLDECGADTCSSDGMTEPPVVDEPSGDDDVKKKGKKRVLSDSEDNEEPDACSVGSKGKDSEGETLVKKKSPEPEKVNKDDVRKSPKKEVAEPKKKGASKEESMKKLKVARKKQKSSGSSLNDILFGAGPVFGDSATPSLSTFKIPKKEEKLKKSAAAAKAQPDTRSKIDIVKEALEKSRMEERKRNLMKRKEMEEKAKATEESAKRSRFDIAKETPDKNHVPGRKDNDWERRGLSDKDRRENADRRESFGNRGNWRGGPERRDAYNRRDAGNDQRKDYDPRNKEIDQRNRFQDPRNSRDSSLSRDNPARPPLGKDKVRVSRFDNPPKQNVTQNSNMGNVSYATPRTYKEYKESLRRGGSQEMAPQQLSTPQKDVTTPQKDVNVLNQSLTSTPRSAGAGDLRRRSPSPKRDHMLRDGANRNIARPLYTEHLHHRDVTRLLQHEGASDHNVGMPSPIEHSSPSDIGSHDFIGPHTPDMPEGDEENKSPEMKASILSLLTGKKQADGYHSLGEDNVESDEDEPRGKSFKRPLPVRRGELSRNDPRARGSRDRDRLVLTGGSDEAQTEEWFNSIMATVHGDTEEEDGLSLSGSSERSYAEGSSRNRDAVSRRDGKGNQLQGMMAADGRGYPNDVHRLSSRESGHSQVDERRAAKSTLAALQDHLSSDRRDSRHQPDHNADDDRDSHGHGQPSNLRNFIQSSKRKQEEDLAQAQVEKFMLEGLTPDRALVRSAIYLKDNLGEQVDMDIVKTALHNIKMKSLTEYMNEGRTRSSGSGRENDQSSEGQFVDRNVAKSALFALQAREEEQKPMSPVYSTPASLEECSPVQGDWSRQSHDSARKSRDNAAQNFAKAMHAPLMQSIMRFGNKSDQGSTHSNHSGRSTPSIDLDFSYQDEKHFEEDMSGLRALLPKVLRPDPSNYKYSKTKSVPKGYCNKFIKGGSCPNRPCRFTHIIPAEPVIEDIRACHRGNDVLGAAEAYAFLKTKCGKKEVRPDVVACMIDMCHKTGLIEMVFQVLLPDIKELKLLNTQLCDCLIAACFPKHCQHLWEIFLFFKQCKEKAVPSKEKIFDLLKDLFMRHDFEKVLMVMQHWSTVDIDCNPILHLAVNSDAHLNGVVLIIDKLPKENLVKLNTELLAELEDRCLTCCHPHGASVLKRAIALIKENQKPSTPPPPPAPPVAPPPAPKPVAPPSKPSAPPPKKHVLVDLNDGLMKLLGAGKLKDALGIFQKILTVNNADKKAAATCGIDMSEVFNQMLMAAVKNMDTRMLLMIFSIGNHGSTLNPQEAMYRLLIIHCVRTNNDGKADLLYKMSPAMKQSVINIPRKIVLKSDLSLEEIRVIMKSFMIDLCRLLRAGGKMSSETLIDFYIELIVKKVDTNAGSVKVLAAIENTIDAVNTRIIKVFKHMNPPIVADIDGESKQITITPASVKTHLLALERLCTAAGKNIVSGAKGPPTPKTPKTPAGTSNQSTTPRATPPAPAATPRT